MQVLTGEFETLKAKTVSISNVTLSLSKCSILKLD